MIILSAYSFFVSHILYTVQYTHCLSFQCRNFTHLADSFHCISCPNWLNAINTSYNWMLVVVTLYCIETMVHDDTTVTKRYLEYLVGSFGGLFSSIMLVVAVAFCINFLWSGNKNKETLLN